ncbi:MAG: aldo/keto reductase [Spirochaetales bacterium]|nr:aldo/keto reductase [Spirochaetales bacterium]
MEYRLLGKTGLNISEVSLGTWQVGGTWGTSFNEINAKKILHAAIDKGINFIDTADVYGNGLSEKMTGEVIKTRSENVYIATKCGRKISPHTSAGYTPKALQKYVEDSLKNMKIECIDLIQLHCPPTEVYYRPEIFELFDRLREEGKIKHLGVSVEKIEEAIKAIDYPNVSTVQIIFNMFRHRPKELFFKLAKEKNIGIIARVPLASGLLSGKITPETKFDEKDHRMFNRDGGSFDKGETFSGVDLADGFKAVKELQKIFPDNATLAQWAIKWILMFPEISCVIPGASRQEQVISNVHASTLSAIPEKIMIQVNSIYDLLIRKSVHQRW